MSYLLMLVILGVLILVHETGHFVCARMAGIPVERFSIGFGPALWKFHRGGVEYRVGVVPLGGYVLLEMEDETDYLNLPLHKRLFFTLGGPLANLILAVPIYAVIIIMANGFSLTNLFVAPVMQVVTMIGVILSALAGLFRHSGELMGLVGLVVEGGRHVGLDTIKALSMAAMLSINLAVFNLLPLPPLDGGKMVLDTLHRIHARLVKIYIPAMITGWVLVIGLMVYATVLDIGRYVA